MSFLCHILVVLLCIGCVQMPTARYAQALDPMVGKSKKADVTRILGSPAKCEPTDQGETCKYRTSYARHKPVPDVYRKEVAYSVPDLSPYDYFDVIETQFDGNSTLTGWKPVRVN